MYSIVRCVHEHYKNARRQWSIHMKTKDLLATLISQVPQFNEYFMEKIIIRKKENSSL